MFLHNAYNFLVIRLRLLSIKCRYTRHCRKTLHSRTKEIRLVIQIQKALWRKLEPNPPPLFPFLPIPYPLPLKTPATQATIRGQIITDSCRAETIITAKNQYACHDLSVWNKRQKSHFISQNLILPSNLPVREKEKLIIGTNSILAWARCGHEVKVVCCLPTPLFTLLPFSRPPLSPSSSPSLLGRPDTQATW